MAIRRDVYYSELVREIMILPGVLRVETLALHKLLAPFGDETSAQGALAGLIAAESDAFPRFLSGCRPLGSCDPDCRTG